MEETYSAEADNSHLDTIHKHWATTVAKADILTRDASHANHDLLRNSSIDILACFVGNNIIVCLQEPETRRSSVRGCAVTNDSGFSAL